MGTSGNLPSPPRFGTPAQAPKTPADWLQFIRWLVQLWKKADDSITDAQALAYRQVPIANFGPNQASVGAATALAAARQNYVSHSQSINVANALLQRSTPAVPNNAAQLATVLAMRQQSALKIGASTVNPVNVQGIHNDRISVGTGTISGTTLTAATGPAFTINWVGSQIAINGSLFFITGWTSGTVITLAGTPPTGSVGWEMMLFPANSYPVGTLFIETDRMVNYRIGTAIGTVNTSGTAVTWVSGPKFSPYWQGLTIAINGSPFVIVGATQTSMTLATSAGTLTGATSSVANSTWFYQDGMMTAAHSSQPTDLDPYQDVGFLFDDLTRLVIYRGVNRGGSGTFYFAWAAGTEYLTLSAVTARTFYAEDNGYLVSVTDYQHLIQWSGSAWTWGPGEGTVGQVASFTSTPVAGVWGFCDGSAYNVLHIIAGVPTAVSITTPDMRGDTFVRGGNYTGVADAGTSPTFTSSSLTFNGTPATLTGTVTAPTFTGTPATLTGTVAAPVFTGTALAVHNHVVPIEANSSGWLGNIVFGTSGTLTATAVGAGSASSAAFNGTNTSSVSGGTPSGTNSAPALTMNSYTPAGTNTAPTLTMNSYTPAGTVGGTATIGIPTVGSGAPKSMALLFYLRC